MSAASDLYDDFREDLRNESCRVLTEALGSCPNDRPDGSTPCLIVPDRFAEIAEDWLDRAAALGAARALRDVAGTLLSLGYADAEDHVILHADRIESGELTP